MQNYSTSTKYDISKSSGGNSSSMQIMQYRLITTAEHVMLILKETSMSLQLSVADKCLFVHVNSHFEKYSTADYKTDYIRILWNANELIIMMLL